MGNLKYMGITLLALMGLFKGGDARARQNIVIGEMSIGYDYQNRNYNLSDTKPGGTSEVADIRDLFTTPRVRLSSRDVSDLFEFTYAPTFHYDSVDSSSFIGQDSNLLAEKNINRDWLVRATNSYFYGQDPVADYVQQNAAIVPGQTTAASEQVVGAGQQQGVAPKLTENLGRHKYWRDDFGLRTDYTYAQNSVVGAGYNFGVLRNVNNDSTVGYSDYDRHEGVGRLSYRFNAKWQAETEASYVKSNNSANVIGSLNSDLEEYHGRFRVNYDHHTHDVFFGQYSYAESVYNNPLSQDAAIHTATVGWDHDFSRRLRMTLSGGPTLVTFQNGGDHTGYNAFAGLVWDFIHSSINASSAYTYDFENFNGLNSGLSKIWRSGLGYSYKFTPQLQTTFSAGYEKNDHGLPLGINPSSSGYLLQYTDETKDAGLVVSYNFLRWYTLSASYRYAQYQSDYYPDYDEHRVLLTLAVSKELLRW